MIIIMINVFKSFGFKNDIQTKSRKYIFQVLNSIEKRFSEIFLTGHFQSRFGFDIRNKVGSRNFSSVFHLYRMYLLIFDYNFVNFFMFKEFTSVFFELF